MKGLTMALLGLCFCMSVHAGPQQQLTVDDIVELTRYNQAGADGEPSLRGMSITTRTPKGGVDDLSQRYIRSVVDDEGRTHHQVLLQVRYVGGWRFYRSARLLLEIDDLPFNAEERRFSRCTSAFLNCDHREVVTAEITRMQLEEALGRGLDVRFETKKPGEDTLVHFPAAYIKAYLIKLDGKEAVKPHGFAMASNG